MKTKKKMIDFILSFGKYPTMNSWNGRYGYSYNVKIHSLPFSSEQKDKLYSMLESDGFYDDINTVVYDFDENMKTFGTHTEKKTLSVNIDGMSAKEIAKRRTQLEAQGYKYDRHGTTIMTMEKTVDVSDFTAGFNGRQGGHLVLYKWNGYNTAGTGWTHEEDELNEMSLEEVKRVYDILKKFEELYNNLIEQAKYLADNFTVEQEEYSVIKTRNVLKEK
jgi:hypothetical protein